MASSLNLGLNCFENLDAAGLEIRLQDKQPYSDVSKEAFLDDFKAGVFPT